MRDGYEGFDEAATLYAQHLPLILEMEKMFDENMLRFATALEAAIAKHVPERMLRFDLTKTPKHDSRPCPARHIGLTDSAKEKTWNHFFLRLDMQDVSAAASGQLTLVADAPHATDDQLRKYRSIPAQEKLAGFCELRRRDRKFFEVTVDLSGDESLESAGKRIAMVLKAMYTAETGKRPKQPLCSLSLRASQTAASHMAI